MVTRLFICYQGDGDSVDHVVSGLNERILAHNNELTSFISRLSEEKQHLRRTLSIMEQDLLQYTEQVGTYIFEISHLWELSVIKSHSNTAKVNPVMFGHRKTVIIYTYKLFFCHLSVVCPADIFPFPRAHFSHLPCFHATRDSVFPSQPCLPLHRHLSNWLCYFLCPICF